MYPLTPFPALLIEKDKKILVIADLHIGWEVSLAHQGIHIPSQVNRIISKTLAVLESSGAEELLVLGDVKHTVAKAEFEEWRDVPFFFEEILKTINSVSIIPGNHDGNLEALLPAGVKLLPSVGSSISKIVLFHGHKLPSPELLIKCKRIIMGHMHPMIALRDRVGFKTMQQVWVNASCRSEELLQALKKRFKSVKLKELFASQISCTIVPSFNDLLGGRAVNLSYGDDQYMGPLVRSGAVNIDEAEIFLLDGTYLGRVTRLKSAL